MKEIVLNNAFFEGCVSVEKTKTGLKPWRVIHEKRALFASPGETLLEQMETASGVRLRFETNSRTICLEVDQKNVKENPGYYDLLIDNDMLQSVIVNKDTGRVCFENIPKGNKVVEIWLPQFCGLTVKSLRIDDNSAAVTVSDERLKWITYGSSTNHCTI